MSTHNICFHGEIRKIQCRYPLLPSAMYAAYYMSHIKQKCLYLVSEANTKDPNQSEHGAVRSLSLLSAYRIILESAECTNLQLQQNIALDNRSITKFIFLIST